MATSFETSRRRGTISLANRVVVITGGGRGIGREIALSCAAEGAKVVVSARSESELAETVSQIQEQHGRKAFAIRCDVSKPEDVTALFEKTETQVGPVYGLICAAAIYGPKGLLENQSMEEWSRALDINVMGTVRCLHASLRRMKERREGRVILFSGGGEGKFPRFSSYVASKGAIWRLTETVAAETYENGVYINAVAPGAVNTKFMEEVLEAGPEVVGEEFFSKTLKQQQSGGTPPDKAAKLVLYLLSERSKGLSGKILSALWDSYESFEDLPKMTQSEIYNFRRITTISDSRFNH